MIRHSLLFALAAGLALGQNPKSISGPDIRAYKTVGSDKLTAHVFKPLDNGPAPRPAIVLFHGGGWNAGDPEWVYDDAKHYAELGMVAVAAEYRLSDQKAITPLDAMEDARDIIRWMHQNTSDLNIDPQRIAAFGYRPVAI